MVLRKAFAMSTAIDVCIVILCGHQAFVLQQGTSKGFAMSTAIMFAAYTLLKPCHHTSKVIGAYTHHVWQFTISAWLVDIFPKQMA